MTTTQNTSFEFIPDGEAYSGGPLYRVESPAGEVLGWAARSNGKRGTTWMAYTPLTLRTVGGFRNREKAAEYLLRVREDAKT